MADERSTFAAPTVVKLRRQQGIVVQDCDVYIGRRWNLGGWDLPHSKWHNPFTARALGSLQRAVAEYEKHVRRSPELMAAIPELYNQRLGCWCKDKPEALCHGDVLVRIAQEMLAAAAAPATPETVQ
jgi:hypothetical protein